jgi:hypothetical protein
MVAPSDKNVWVCMNCIYYHESFAPDNGFCHRYPPIHVPEEKGPYNYSFPLVEYCEYCGEWVDADQRRVFR